MFTAILVALGLWQPLPAVPVKSVVVRPDGHWLAAASVRTPDNHQGVLVWNESGPVLLARTSDDLPAHVVSLDPTGSRVAVGLGHMPRPGEADGLVQIWEVPSGRELFRDRLTAGVDRISWSPDGVYLAVSRSNYGAIDEWRGAIQVLQSDDGTLVKRYDMESQGTLAITKGGLALASMHGQRLNVRVAHSGRLIRSWTSKALYLASGQHSEWLASSDGPRTQLWDVESGRYLGEIRRTGRVLDGPDGRYVALLENGVQVYDIKERRHDGSWQGEAAVAGVLGKGTTLFVGTRSGDVVQADWLTQQSVTRWPFPGQ